MRLILAAITLLMTGFTPAADAAEDLKIDALGIRSSVVVFAEEGAATLSRLITDGDYAVVFLSPLDGSSAGFGAVTMPGLGGGGPVLLGNREIKRGKYKLHVISDGRTRAQLSLPRTSSRSDFKPDRGDKGAVQRRAATPTDAVRTELRHTIAVPTGPSWVLTVGWLKHDGPALASPRMGTCVTAATAACEQGRSYSGSLGGGISGPEERTIHIHPRSDYDDGPQDAVAYFYGANSVEEFAALTVFVKL